MVGSHVFVIAEAGSNWRVGARARDEQMAKRLVDVAVEAGADSIKFQTYRSKTVYVKRAGDIELPGATTRSINEVFDDLEMPYDMIPEIAAYARDHGIEFMSTPFSIEDADAVDPHVVRHKVASYEINHVRLVEHIARRGKPMIMSTGAATDEDIAFGLDVARGAGATDITLMQCTARYPAPSKAMGLGAIPYLRKRYGVEVGLSDHSLDPLVAPVSAVALGAVAIEKHFTIDRRLPGPDHPFAIEPGELASMVRAIREAEQMRSPEEKVVQEAEAELRTFAVRAIQSTRDIAVDEAFVEGENIDVLRPGLRRRGLHPCHLEALRTRRASRAIAAGDGIEAEDVTPPLP